MPTQVETEFLTQNAKRSCYWKVYSKKCHSFSFRFKRGGGARRFKKYVDRNKVSQTFSLDLPVIERNLIYICRAMFTLTSLNKYIIALSKGPTAISKKSLLAGNLFKEKKVCAFEWCLMLIKKYTKSFGGKKSCFERLIFSNWKFCIFFCFYVRRCSNPQKFFSSRQPSIRKKK